MKKSILVSVILLLSLIAFGQSNNIDSSLLHSKPLWSFGFQPLNYNSESQGISIVFFNSSDKIINSINFTVIPYDLTGNRITDNMGNNYQNCQIMGPINPNIDAQYHSNELFSTTIIDHYDITSIMVQYTDNSIKYFNYCDIQASGTIIKLINKTLF